MGARRRQQILLILGCVALLWSIECVNAFLGHRLNRWGILPRTLAGLAGIPLSPFLHGSFAHLILNTVPLVTLGGFVALQSTRIFLTVSLWLILLSGGALWLPGGAWVVRAQRHRLAGRAPDSGAVRRHRVGSLAHAALYFLGGPLVWVARWRAGGAAGNPSGPRHVSLQPDGAVS